MTKKEASTCAKKIAKVIKVFLLEKGRHQSSTVTTQPIRKKMEIIMEGGTVISKPCTIVRATGVLAVKKSGRRITRGDRTTKL